MIETINNWKPEVRSLLRTLEKHGCAIIKGNNGEYSFSFGENRAKFVEDLIACDEAHLYVKGPDGRSRTLFLVLGNSPGEIVSDYSMPAGQEFGTDVLDKVTEEHAAKWETRSQPKLRGGYLGGKFVKEDTYRAAHKALVDKVNHLIHHRGLHVRQREGTLRVVDCFLSPVCDVFVRGVDDGKIYEVYYNTFMDGEGNDHKFERVR